MGIITNQARLDLGIVAGNEEHVNDFAFRGEALAAIVNDKAVIQNEVKVSVNRQVENVHRLGQRQRFHGINDMSSAQNVAGLYPVYVSHSFQAAPIVAASMRGGMDAAKSLYRAALASFIAD